MTLTKIIEELDDCVENLDKAVGELENSIDTTKLDDAVGKFDSLSYVLEEFKKEMLKIVGDVK